ncbi:MAG: DUF4870 domain-containing protein [Chloroflexi bacterium]|nr:DUF4870 domain-containing protein [Chloroflexota bacterium]
MSKSEKMAPADEWTTAMLAHASIFLTVIFSAAGGIGALIGPVVALAIYFGYREKSRFVAFHALQSCVYQAVGLLLYLGFVAVGGGAIALAWTISGLLAALLIGLILMPGALLLTLVVVLLMGGLPLVWLGYGLYGAYQVYQGRDFRYRAIGDWIAREVRF